MIDRENVLKCGGQIINLHKETLHAVLIGELLGNFCWVFEWLMAVLANYNMAVWILVGNDINFT